MSKRFSDPITLFSGLPGHGKTLMAITYAREARAEGQRVFQLGIKDCNPVVAEPFELGVERWRELPSGSILVLDEAQDYLPVRGPGRPPEWIAEFARLRHYGLQLWLVTQDVRNLDSFVRRLIGAHVHIERKMGFKSAVVYRWEHVTDDTRDYHARQAAARSAFTHDKRNYQFYTSATQHLIKKRIPWQVWLGVPVVIAMVVALWFAYRLFTGHGAYGGEKSLAPSVVATTLSVGGSAVPLSNAAYLSRLVPRLPGVMWTAPVFDEHKVVSSPETYCYSSEVRGCRCFTEQMTRLDVPLLSCLRIVRDGIYNPFRVVAVSPGRSSDGVVNPPSRSPVSSSVAVPPAAAVPVPVHVPVAGGGGAVQWPRPDFAYKVPFPGVSH
jgi:zona occludens toxin